jgi:predicted nucleic acid-binding protein
MVYLDSCIAIYWVEQKQAHFQQLRQAFMNIDDGKFAYSSLVQLECLIYPYRTNDTKLIARYQHFFDLGMCLTLSDEIFDKAAQLRANFPSLKTPDALHLACTQHYQCSEFWTNDERLRKTAPNLAVNIIEKYS